MEPQGRDREFPLHTNQLSRVHPTFVWTHYLSVTAEDQYTSATVSYAAATSLDLHANGASGRSRTRACARDRHDILTDARTRTDQCSSSPPRHYSRFRHRRKPASLQPRYQQHQAPQNTSPAPQSPRRTHEQKPRKGSHPCPYATRQAFAKHCCWPLWSGR